MKVLLSSITVRDQVASEGRDHIRGQGWASLTERLSHPEQTGRNGLLSFVTLKKKQKNFLYWMSLTGRGSVSPFCGLLTFLPTPAPKVAPYSHLCSKTRKQGPRASVSSQELRANRRFRQLRRPFCNSAAALPISLLGESKLDKRGSLSLDKQTSQEVD